MRRSALDRFFENVRSHPDGCWEWTGNLWFWDGHPFMPSRWAYRYWVDEIPDGHRLTRLCALRHCVNPQHLEPSPRVKTAEMADPSTAWGRTKDQKGMLRPCV